MQKKNVAALLLISVFAVTACSTTSTTEFPGDSINNDNLGMVENESYEFYHPDNYESYDNELQDLSYSSPEVNELGGNNNIGLVVTEGEDKGVKPTDEECQEIADELAGILDGEVIESKSLDEGEMYGCYNRIDATFAGLELVSENRAVFLKDEENATVYSINVTYEPSASEDEIQNLQDSLTKFKLL